MAKIKIKPERKLYNTQEVIELLSWMLRRLKRKKGKYKYQKFTFKEVCFLITLIFNRPKNLLFIHLADYLRNNTIRYDNKRLQNEFESIPFNGLNSKKLNFFYNILLFHNAKKAAILAGYSPRSAAQTGYRIIKEIQGYKRIGNSSRFIKIENFTND